MPRRVSALRASLEVDERLAGRVVAAEPQVLPADVADDAAPQRVVEVEHDELAGGASVVAAMAATMSAAASSNTASTNGILPR